MAVCPEYIFDYRDLNLDDTQYTMNGGVVSPFAYWLTVYGLYYDAANPFTKGPEGTVGTPEYNEALRKFIEAKDPDQIKRLAKISNAKCAETEPETVVNPKPKSKPKQITRSLKPISLKKIDLENFKPRPNPLLKFNNMTYNISIYTLSAEHYKKFINTGTKSVKGLHLLMQSGGINDTGSPTANFGAIRSKHFNNDFYINEVQLKSLISGTSVGMSHNSYELNFSITEPMGITFLESLYNAIIEYNKELGVDSPATFLNQHYLMVIRFYGYDEDGNQLRGKESENSDENAFAEKWIPFIFTDIKFTLEETGIKYLCTAVTPQSHIANDQIHGIIPFNIGLQGQKLKDLINGKSKLKEKSIVSVGLVDALNKWQEKQVKCNKQSLADVYEIDIDDEIAEAELVAPGSIVVERTGMTNDSNPLDELKARVEDYQNAIKTKTFSINAGIKIIRFLDLVIRTSKYISNQYDAVYDPATNEIKEFKKKNPGPLNWFKIRTKIEILGFDNIRNQWAYKITYKIRKQEIKSLSSLEFAPQNECYFPHKEYNYWFTGRNTEVLSFRQDFNFLYYTTFGNRYSPNPSKPEIQTANARSIYAYRSSPTQSNLGGDRNAADPAANAASELYSPADQALATIDIVGDPEWIAQSELFYDAAVENPKYKRFLPDGSINYDTAEVYFAINFNVVVDYDLETGVADVTQKNKKDPYGALSGGVSQYSYVYRANTIISQFSDGKFVQKLEGNLMFIPEKCITGVEKDNQQTEAGCESPMPTNRREIKTLPPGCEIVKKAKSTVESDTPKANPKNQCK